VTELYRVNSQGGPLRAALATATGWRPGTCFHICRFGACVLWAELAEQFV
jgi:hypothetical protein